MTNPKTSESRAVAARAKPAAAPAPGDSEPAPETSPDNQAVVLEQLVALTQSISDLVKQNAEPETPPVPPVPPEAARVRFAYDFLGVALGRRAPSVFQLRSVEVTRGFGKLTFNKLGDATAAKIRAENNIVQELTGLRDGVAVVIDQGPKAIFDDLRIDSLVFFTSPGGVPVALGPCQDPVAFGE